MILSKQPLIDLIETRSSPTRFTIPNLVALGQIVLTSVGLMMKASSSRVSMYMQKFSSHLSCKFDCCFSYCVRAGTKNFRRLGPRPIGLGVPTLRNTFLYRILWQLVKPYGRTLYLKNLGDAETLHYFGWGNGLIPFKQASRYYTTAFVKRLSPMRSQTFLRPTPLDGQT